MLDTHILVVDDEPEIAESLADYLSRKAGYQVTKATDGQQAVALLEATVDAGATPVDLVVLDRRMPGFSGLEVLNWIREHPTLQYTRVVMLTGAAGSQEKIEALSAGADDYITKPYYPRELLARVQTILRTQRLEKQLQRQSQQLAALNRVSNEVTTTLDVGQIPLTAVQGVQAVLGVELAALFLLDPTRQFLQCRALVRGEQQVSAVSVTVPHTKGATGLAYRQQETVCINEPEADARFLTEVDAPCGMTLTNLLLAPLVMRGHAVGVLSAGNKEEGPFGEVDMALFASLANAVSRALENASLFQNVKVRQQELRESHSRLQAVINGILHPIYTIDEQWRLVAVNRQKAQEVQARRHELVGQPCYAAFFDRDSPCEHCLVPHTLTKGQPHNWSVRWVAADHLPQEWEVHAYPLPASQPGAPRVVVVWQDRTEERRLEHSLMQAGKLAAIGQLAAGVAHEINNPLTAINANAHMLKMFISSEDNMYEAVDLIARAGDRAANVVRGLLDFARQSQYSFEAGDVNHSIRQALRLVSYQVGSANIEVILHLDEELPQVKASWEHIKTVWLNLLLNAQDALLERPSKREITIASRKAPAGDHVQVLFSDNGTGMSAAEAAHIFEPFYTTKDPGQGTGLGLATSQRIVQQHGGTIEVVSKPGEGATFIVRLPMEAEVHPNTTEISHGSSRP